MSSQAHCQTLNYACRGVPPSQHGIGRYSVVGPGYARRAIAGAKLLSAAHIESEIGLLESEFPNKPVLSLEIRQREGVPPYRACPAWIEGEVYRNWQPGRGTASFISIKGVGKRLWRRDENGGLVEDYDTFNEEEDNFAVVSVVFTVKSHVGFPEHYQSCQAGREHEVPIVLVKTSRPLDAPQTRDWAVELTERFAEAFGTFVTKVQFRNDALFGTLCAPLDLGPLGPPHVGPWLSRSQWLTTQVLNCSKGGAAEARCEAPSLPFAPMVY